MVYQDDYYSEDFSDYSDVSDEIVVPSSLIEADYFEKLQELLGIMRECHDLYFMKWVDSYRVEKVIKFNRIKKKPIKMDLSYLNDHVIDWYDKLYFHIMGIYPTLDTIENLHYTLRYRNKYLIN